MKKSNNTPKYRADKRVVAFIEPITKKKIQAESKKTKISVSSIIASILEDYYWEKV